MIGWRVVIDLTAVCGREDWTTTEWICDDFWLGKVMELVVHLTGVCGREEWTTTEYVNGYFWSWHVLEDKDGLSTTSSGPSKMISSSTNELEWEPGLIVPIMGKDLSEIPEDPGRISSMTQLFLNSWCLPKWHWMSSGYVLSLTGKWKVRSGET